MSGDQKNVTASMNEDDICHVDIIEGLFFAYRDFVAGPDEMLDEIGFGRAHHRVMFFVNRRPGLTVAELLEILKITKQSLARVLKQLIIGGYIRQSEGTHDRRKRLLYPTEKGREKILRLSQPQSLLIERSLSELSEQERQAVATFLSKMAAGKPAT